MSHFQNTSHMEYSSIVNWQLPTLPPKHFSVYTIAVSHPWKHGISLFCTQFPLVQYNLEVYGPVLILCMFILFISGPDIALDSNIAWEGMAK